MNLDLHLEHTYPHPPEKVWRAIATSEGLEAWLMRNDFEPVAGRSFRFFFIDDDTGAERTVAAKVLEIDPPRRLVWMWQNDNEAEASRVTIELAPVAEGTCVTLRHTGPVSDDTGGKLTRGWPTKLRNLEIALGRS